LWFLEIKFETPGKYEKLKTNNFIIRNSSTLNFLPATAAHGAYLCLKGFAKNNVCLSLAFPWKQT
jgi:hypothetical protein